MDYGGSTGHGRAYRRLLDGAWGIVDIEDVCAAARWLAGQGIMGWSMADMMARYQHLTQEVRRDIADRLGALLWEPPEDKTA